MKNEKLRNEGVRVRPGRKGMRENVIKNKSYDFALRIVKLCQNLRNQHEYILSRQLLRSGTSIGANVEEADVAFSKKDFIYKMQIALKEAKESHYWIRLLRDSNYLDKIEAENLLEECNELIYLLVAILKKSKRNE